MAGVSDLVVASAQVRSGKLYIRNRRAFDQQIAQMREGWQLEVAVSRLRAARSVQANRYYWGVVVELISEHTGYTPEEVHDFLKAKFIPKRLAMAKGNGEIVDEYVLGGSTRRLNTVEFYAYCEVIRQWAIERLDVYIPTPEEAPL
jgi:hypothetical protein